MLNNVYRLADSIKGPCLFFVRRSSPSPPLLPSFYREFLSRDEKAPCQYLLDPVQRSGETPCQCVQDTTSDARWLCHLVAVCFIFLFLRRSRRAFDFFADRGETPPCGARVRFGFNASGSGSSKSNTFLCLPVPRHWHFFFLEYKRKKVLLLVQKCSCSSALKYSR